VLGFGDSAHIKNSSSMDAQRKDVGWGNLQKQER
jgi:hypothetical protein